MSDERDRAIEALMSRAVPRSGDASGTCLDADTLAAWFEGSLRADERSAAEAHAASCARCQAMLAAMARAEPAVERRRWWQALPLRWLVPATAAVAAAALWVAVVPHERSIQPGPVPPAPAAAVDKAPAEARQETAAPPGSVADAVAPQREAKAFQDRGAAPLASKVQPRADAKPDDARREALRPAQAAETSNAAGDRRQFGIGGATPLDIASPDPSSKWRISAAGVVEHTSDGGVTWIPQEIGPAAAITAGASPSRDVVWLVGRGGIVFLSTDGHTWQRRNVAESVDLVGVRPVDGTTATVTAADGRQFTTHDAGLTWSPARLQEPPAAPF